MYVRYVEGKKDLLSLPTVVVDFTTNEDGDYMTMTEYTCVNKVGVATTELRFSSREKSIEDYKFSEMKQKAIDMGIPSKTVDNVNIVDHSKCRDATFDELFLQ